MKKILFLAVFVFLISSLLFAAEEAAKSFDIGDGGIVKIHPVGNYLNIQIVYDHIADAPEAAQENLKVSDTAGRQKRSTYNFSIKLLDGDGYVVCGQFLSFSGFFLDESGDQPKIVLGYQTAQCGVNSIERISSVAVDYSRH